MLARFRPSPSMAVACAALIVALAGSAYAVTSLPKSSVGTKQLKNGAVGTNQLKNNAVTSKKVKDDSLTARDFKSGQLPRGPRGPAGPTVSASASSGASFNVPQSNTTTPTAPVQAQITTTFQSRLVANGTAAVKNTVSEAAPGDVDCVLSIDPPPPNLVTGTHLSQRARTRLPVSSTTDHSTIALTGRSASLPPGTYLVGLHCISFSSSDATIDAADLTVIAVAG